MALKEREESRVENFSSRSDVKIGAYLKIPCLRFIGQFKCKSEQVEKKM